MPEYPDMSRMSKSAPAEPDPLASLEFATFSIALERTRLPPENACLTGLFGHRARSVKWSFRIATVAGIQVRIHFTFLLLLVFYAWIYYTEGGPKAAMGGVAFTLLIFLCVLLHEFGHAFAAKAFGIRTPDITLLPIGGVARLERMPANPWQELVIAIA